ncbi:MAG: WecB/TagA/CpsF family glycosyltransferase [Flavobacterium sp.]|uniref:WecB/TagA/CpsF family glycosyltransferase n=1 Tax=Flavobacterium sp. TaxID=239 RepID=UPI001B0E891A|nr:WecB/TagA/CpsF family glycosyltransferase [Flavobacterium sp.]MBO9584147.1 WecB/TagA/CpsF family glycosyltransferase [Flavobacterium sp.]
MIKSTSVVPLMDYSIYSGDLSDCFTGSKTLINTINQYSYCIAEKDLDFKKALLESDILLPDGIGIVSAVRLFTHKTIKKVAGADIHQFLLTNLNKKGGTCFYLGSSQNTLNKITARISKDFPNIKLSTFSPPYKDEFSQNDIKKMLEEVNAFKPDVLFVGMTAPKQEKWSNMYKNELDARVICSIGAVFDFYAGTIARPSKFCVKIGLEWFVRLLKEPRRMWKRYLYYGPIFIKCLFEKKIKMYF